MAVTGNLHKLLCLSLAVLFTAIAGKAQTFSPEIRLGIEVGKSLLEAAAYRNISLEGYAQWRAFPRLGIHIGGGYAISAQLDKAFNNIQNYRAQGYFMKPGAIYFFGKGNAHIGLLSGISWIRETGTYSLSGPYWGNLEGPADMQDRLVFLEVMFNERFRIRQNWYVQLGIAQDFFFQRSSEHLPKFVPGNGNDRTRSFPFLSCSLQYGFPVF